MARLVRRSATGMMAGLLASAVVLVALGAGGVASAQDDYPDRPIRIVVPYAPGGGTDNLIRLLAAKVSESIGQQLVIENLPGGATQVGVAAVLQAERDGYTIITQAETDILGPLIGDREYDPLENFTAITTLATSPVMMSIHSSIQAETVSELVELANNTPGSLSYASGQATSTTRMAGEVFNVETGTQLVNIPYQGNGQSVIDAVAGRVPILFGNISTVKQHVDAGALRALALTGPKRNPAMPDVPTFTEAGYPGMDVYTSWFLLAPTGTPDYAIEKLNEHFAMAMSDPETAATMDANSFEPAANTPEEANQLIAKAQERMLFIIEKAGLTPD